MNRFFLWSLIVLNLVGAAPSLRAQAHLVKSDETLVLYETAARFDLSRKVWVLPIHGAVYENEGSVVRKGLIANIFKESFGLTPSLQTQKNFDQRIDLFLVDHERGKKVLVEIAGKSFWIGPTEANGHFFGTIELPAETVGPFTKEGRLEYKVSNSAGNRPLPVGEVFMIPPTGRSVISDIDDTIKLTEVTDRVKMLDRTFFQDYQAVPGMAELYRQWVRQGAFIHFVSSSPWQLYPPLREFVEKAGFPGAVFSLKLVRWADETFFNLFEKGTQSKPAQIEPILQAYPQRRFILIGDSGEQDPEVYASIYRKHPQQIEAIFIRNVTQEKADNERFQKTFRGIDPKTWKLFDDPKEIAIK